MNHSEVMAVLTEAEALRQGHFRLSSGRHSDTYVQCALVLQHPGVASRLGHELAELLAPHEPNVVVGPAVGGLIIGHEVGRHLGLRTIFSERVDGEMTLRRGFSLGRGDRAAVVEDVVTTGRSPREVINLAQGADAEVVAVGSIVDRSGGVSFGVPFVSLLTLVVGTWEADECPLCRDGDEPVAPGSRYLVR